MKKLEHIPARDTLKYLTILIAERHELEYNTAREVLLTSLLRNLVVEEILSMSDYILEDEPT